tara:strand:+ start:94 stop:351 length:258 start_codon:yes stop_codon:yes gene_type:complete
MSVKETIEQKLTYHLKPSQLIVIDESEDHIGHSGYVQGGETHFRVFLRSKKLKGKTRLDCQRSVYKILQTEMKESIHALALDLGE